MSNKTDKYIYTFEAKDKSNKNRKFCILKPTRKMKEEGELYYSSKLSQFISSGILPKIVWDKIFKDNGGIISTVDQEEYSNLFIELGRVRDLLNSKLTKPIQDRTDEESFEIDVLEGDLIRTRKRMQELEMNQINAFENTAEAKARNRTIVWWACMLSVEETSPNIFQPILGSGNLENRLDFYDQIIENDEFLTNIFSRINYLVTIWYLGSASSFEDFKSLDEEYIKRLEQENNEDNQFIELTQGGNNLVSNGLDSNNQSDIANNEQKELEISAN